MGGSEWQLGLGTAAGFGVSPPFLFAEGKKCALLADMSYKPSDMPCIFDCLVSICFVHVQ